MPLPVIAFFPWLVGLFASVMGGLFTWVTVFVGARLAFKFVLITSYLLAVATITAAIAITVKAMIIGIQTTMPTTLGVATYFLPNNINAVVGVYVGMRVSFSLYAWAKDRLTAIAILAS